MATAFQDYYTTLGIARTATAAQIKKAFRKLALKYHPDVAKDKATAEEKFRTINEAYQVLSDPEKRQKYDRLGAGWDQAEGATATPRPHAGHAEHDVHFGGTGYSDFFEQYFSGGSRYGFPPDAAGAGTPRGSVSQRGHDIEGDILVTLEEAMQGTLRAISMQSRNRSTGQVETQEFSVRIPPGAVDGRRLRVPGHGESGVAAGPAGDLYLRVRHAAHPQFTSSGSDLIYEMDVAPWEAVLGAEINVQTLDGMIKMRVPAGAENGQQLRVKARGFPIGKTGTRGDFYVVLMVQIPTTLTEAEGTLWEQLRAISTFTPRAPIP